MKLIDLLVKELPKRGGWPEGVKEVEQNSEGQLFEMESDYCSDFKLKKCDDWITDVVTKQQYESALAASDGWIEWGGGECPVEDGTIIDVRYRDMKEKTLPANELMNGRDATSAYWRHDNQINDIIAYRPHRDINSRANDDRMEQDLNECIGQDVDMQEWNGDGVPPIGCACEMQDSKGTWLPVDIIAKNDGFTFGWSYDYRIVLFGDKADEFRPLRTEAEKAREKLASSLHIAAGASPIELNGIGPLYFKLADAIISGSVFGTTFKENK